MKKIDNSAISKYSSFEKIKLKNRSWPTNQITNAPIWCSVDLRDGNQALIEPMGIEKKLRFFAMLIEIITLLNSSSDLINSGTECLSFPNCLET